ncbi:HD domain-containing protein [Curtobacterium citreum]|uniref:HD domain-containing protein n=1 Tax=Curtobacterium citreum TaxID=2036 RepID=UPI00254A5E39|nr:HD domain-containing protein [Curtobacterium citreum]MDK8172268.1 HD domain-containing protein [Curtobacterium citreum]
MISTSTGPLSVSVDVKQETRDGVVASLPLINEIQDDALRAAVIEGWALSLELNGFNRVEELPGSGMPTAPVLGDQTHHLLGVTRIALGIQETLEATVGHQLWNRDEVIAGGLCHDIGKTFEYNVAHRARWAEDSRPSGAPALRHPAYGAHIAMLVGLPESIVHVAGNHSPEGRYVERSALATLIHHADDNYWFILESALGWEQKVPRL